MLSPRSPSDWGQLSSEKEDEASQKMAVKDWKAEKSRMPSRISKQKAKVVAYHEGGVVATILHDQGTGTAVGPSWFRLGTAPLVIQKRPSPPSTRSLFSSLIPTSKYLLRDRRSRDVSTKPMQSRPPAEASWAELPREDAQVQDIALYKRERAVHQGSLIAVNANYTCYAIRGARTLATAQAGFPRPHNHALA